MNPSTSLADPSVAQTEPCSAFAFAKVSAAYVVAGVPPTIASRSTPTGRAVASGAEPQAVTSETRPRL